MKFSSLVWVLLFAAALPAQENPRGGIDRNNLDPTCKPCTDFWRYANGGWLDKNPIPARYSRWGSFSVLGEANRERLHALLENAARDKTAKPGSNEAKIGAFFASCMDTAAIEARGAKPLERDLARVAALRTAKDLGPLLIELQGSGQVVPFFLMGGQDLKNSKDVIAQIVPAGISLPDRDYYFKTDARSVRIRDEYVKHVAKMLELVGDAPEAAAAEGRAVLAFETALADAMMTNVQRRDPYARYHKMDVSGVAALAPDIDWKALLRANQVADTTPVNVSEPEFMKRLERQLTTVPVEDWKTWLRWRVVNAGADRLSKAFVDQDFYFSETVLRGVKEQLPRWQTCTVTIDRSMGEALGQMFVAKHFPPAAKQRMSELVSNLRATLREELETANWLTAETRQNAQTKLAAFRPKIGYPDRWRDYSAVEITRSDFFADVRAATRNNRRYNLAKIGKPLDRNDWGMTPPTVNAYYSPTMNEIVFPAGILQSPFFNLEADDAVNYGAIGAVIGHEMGHGFDDQGSRFDAEGNLKNWWTAEDRKNFDQRVACVVDEYDKIEVGNGLHHKGRLVVGEAMGDLGGLTLAYRAYHRSLRGKPEPPVIDGFTADQRFFLAFARVWGDQTRPEALELQLNTDPHPIAKFRAIGTLQNMPEFHKAFGCQEGDPMVRPAAQRCRLW